MAVQAEALGTGDAARVGLEALAEAGATSLVVSGDTPLLTSEASSAKLLEAHRSSHPPRPHSPRSRRMRAPTGGLYAPLTARCALIVEVADATPEQTLAIREVGTSIYVFRADALRWALGRLDARNAQGDRSTSPTR